ncbi:MAG: ribose 5-phosphate isomerase B [Deltaproteobacteria bacterium]|jgi:ribose 5-phosphate isomerase B|nr:ribose 5-phosphate isomerase B [Deltaproteobacteria bacterium]
MPADNNKVAIGADHAGLEFKALIRDQLIRLGFQYVDAGAPEGTERVDYPIVAADVAKLIQNGECVYGVLTCGTGLGMSMAANRFRSIRAANCSNEAMARLARAHNDANVLTLGQRLLGPDLALSILEVFLTTPFEGGRHQGRLSLFN